MKFFTPLKTAVLITILSYLILNSIVIFNGNRYKKELSKFDLNQDGFFTENEMSEQQQKAMEKVTHDTSKTFAPFNFFWPSNPNSGIIICRLYRASSSFENSISSKFITKFF